MSDTSGISTGDRSEISSVMSTTSSSKNQFFREINFTKKIFFFKSTKWITIWYYILFYLQVIWIPRLTDRIEKYLLMPHFKLLLPEQVFLEMMIKNPFQKKSSWKKNTMLSTNPKVHHHHHLWSPPKVK